MSARVIGEDDIGPIFAEGDDLPPDRRSGGPAFPVGHQHYLGGMSLRDYFAAKALTGLIDVHGGQGEVTRRQMVRNAYEIADAMMAERDRGD